MISSSVLCSSRPRAFWIRWNRAISRLASNAARSSRSISSSSAISLCSAISSCSLAIWSATMPCKIAHASSQLAGRGTSSRHLAHQLKAGSRLRRHQLDDPPEVQAPPGIDHVEGQELAVDERVVDRLARLQPLKTDELPAIGVGPGADGPTEVVHLFPLPKQPLAALGRLLEAAEEDLGIVRPGWAIGREDLGPGVVKQLLAQLGDCPELTVGADPGGPAHPSRQVSRLQSVSRVPSPRKAGPPVRARPAHRDWWARSPRTTPRS